MTVLSNAKAILLLSITALHNKEVSSVTRFPSIEDKGSRLFVK